MSGASGGARTGTPSWSLSASSSRWSSPSTAASRPSLSGAAFRICPVATEPTHARVRPASLAIAVCDSPERAMAAWTFLASGVVVTDSMLVRLLAFVTRI